MMDTAMRYQVGDKVLITRTKITHRYRHWSSEMNNWCGKTMTISSSRIIKYSLDDDDRARYRMFEDGGKFSWPETLIDGIDFSASDSNEFELASKNEIIKFLQNADEVFLGVGGD